MLVLSARLFGLALEVGQTLPQWNILSQACLGYLYTKNIKVLFYSSKEKFAKAPTVLPKIDIWVIWFLS